MEIKKSRLRLRAPSSPGEWGAFAAVDWQKHGQNAKLVQLAKLVAIRHRVAKDKDAREALKASMEVERQEGRLRGRGLSRGVVHLCAPNLSGSAKTRAIQFVRIARKKAISAKEALTLLRQFGLDRVLRSDG